MNFVTLFLVTAVISFVGSIQLGPVNLAVIKTVLNKGYYSALYVAIGGVLPEILYAWIALRMSEFSFLKQNIITLQWLVVPFFVVIGVYNIFRKSKTITTETNKKYTSGIFTGLLLALFNFQLLPFWLSIVIFYSSGNMLHTTSFVTSLAFALGAALGAFSLLALIVYITHRNKQIFTAKLSKFNLNTIFGCLFIILSIAQTINLLIKY